MCGAEQLQGRIEEPWIEDRLILLRPIAIRVLNLVRFFTTRAAA
jgi:hypothetical protein